MNDKNCNNSFKNEDIGDNDYIEFLKCEEKNIWDIAVSNSFTIKPNSKIPIFFLYFKLFVWSTYR